MKCYKMLSVVVARRAFDTPALATPALARCRKSLTNELRSQSRTCRAFNTNVMGKDFKNELVRLLNKQLFELV